MANVEVLTQEEIQGRVNSPLSKAALWDPDGTALVDPARLVWSFIQKAMHAHLERNSKRMF